MPLSSIPASTLEFLRELDANNHRDWFVAHKDWYQEERDAFRQFTEALMERMQQHDQIEDKKIFRIYRDLRFAKDKTPYKPYFSATFKRAGARLRGGYYLSVAPNNQTVAGGGFYGPSKEDLRLIRQKVARNAPPLREILNAPAFRETFGELKGERVKTAPKGYSKDHPAVDLLRYKQFYVLRNFADEEVSKPDFAAQIDASYRRLRPFFDHMSEILTTDLDGAPLYE